MIRFIKGPIKFIKGLTFYDEIHHWHNFFGFAISRIMIFRGNKFIPNPIRFLFIKRSTDHYRSLSTRTLMVSNDLDRSIFIFVL